MKDEFSCGYFSSAMFVYHLHVANSVFDMHVASNNGSFNS